MSLTFKIVFPPSEVMQPPAVVPGLEIQVVAEEEEVEA
jgi:hypothetical protein